MRPARDPIEVLVVDDTPSACRFSDTIQAAVNAADEGDVIVVEPGTYAPFTIDGKSLVVIGEGAPNASFVVQNLLPGQLVVLRGFREVALPRFTDNAGSVWVEDCLWKNGTVITATGCEWLGVFRCSYTSTTASLNATDSTLVAYDSLFRGADGADATFDEGACFFEEACYFSGGGSGVTGIRLNAESSAFLFSSLARGGSGGSPWYTSCSYCFFDCIPGGCGGNGLSLSDVSQAVLLDMLLTGGASNTCTGLTCDGQPIAGIGTVTELPGHTGSFEAAAPVLSGSPIDVEFAGPPGWTAHLTYSKRFAPEFIPDRYGYSVVAAISPTVPIGTFPGSGMLDVSLPLSDPLHPDDEAAIVFLQAKVYDPISGIARLGTPSVLVVLRDACP